MEIRGYSDIGIKREENQDSFMGSIFEYEGTNYAVLVVADGMGGLNDGRLASNLVISEIKSSIDKGLFFTKDIISACYRANEFLLRQEKRSGTTMTYVITDGKTYEILHIGDSRCYEKFNDKLVQITDDHSALNTIIKEGRIPTEDEKRRLANKLTRCIGMTSTLNFESYRGTVVGNGFLVCSDGFWHLLQQGLLDITNLEFAINQCKSYGETDNISVAEIIL